MLRTSKDSGATWSYPSIIVPEHGLRHMPIESVIRLSDGSIALPCDAVTEGSGGTALWISPDNGVTWTDAGGTIAGIHAGVVELRDGRLLALGRGDNVNGRMPMSLSSDRGAKWNYSASPFQPIGGGQRLVVRRLKKGPIFLASFADEPEPITDAAGKQRTIKGLYAALSYDDGATWKITRPITDDGPGRQVEGHGRRAFYDELGTNAEPKGYMAMCQGAQRRDSSHQQPPALRRSTSPGLKPPLRRNPSSERSRAGNARLTRIRRIPFRRRFDARGLRPPWRKQRQPMSRTAILVIATLVVLLGIQSVRLHRLQQTIASQAVLGEPLLRQDRHECPNPRRRIAPRRDRRRDPRHTGSG